VFSLHIVWFLLFFLFVVAVFLLITLGIVMLDVAHLRSYYLCYPIFEALSFDLGLLWLISLSFVIFYLIKLITVLDLKSNDFWTWHDVA
jgi:hypothetical protein